MIFAYNQKAVAKVGNIIVEIEIILSAFVGIVCGAVGVWLWQKRVIKNLESTFNEKLEKQRLENQSLSVTLAESKGTMQSMESTFTQRIKDLQENFELRSKEEKAHYEERLIAEKTHSQDILHRLQEQYTLTQTENNKKEEELKNAFKAISADILRQNTQSFNQMQLLSLQPLREEITRFTKQLNDNHTSTLTQHTALQTQIEQLSKLNMQLSNDAHNLTNALKGGNKTQGNWGEIILQRVFENSGLQEGREYELQTSMRNDEAQMLRPDAIVKLPKSGNEQRCVIVDSKTSLIAYEKLCNAENEIQKLSAQKELAHSIQTHFSNLSAKNYQQYLQGQKLDFVLMFIPIEGAFLEAMQYDSTLYDRAYQKGVVLVSPTTIMAVLKIIHNLWQIEYRDKNINKIFSEIKKLFERIEKFENVLEQLGRNIDTMKKTYDDVMTKYNGKQGIANTSKNIHNLLRGAETQTLSDSINTNYTLGNNNEN
ncbi:DNA recombination protein RmuC [Helicobacter japonicus]|uniref:DNA recombination protein RmuC n=1 Tax=Helicobacter japonicus TaxID=425400 RepID=UPI0023F25100|nr:DNA recombination protein RmuC [Helicobacter japonicus]